MFLWDGLHALLSSNSIRVVGKCIHNLISSWLISFILHNGLVNVVDKLLTEKSFPFSVHNAENIQVSPKTSATLNKNRYCFIFRTEISLTIKTLPTTKTNHGNYRIKLKLPMFWSLQEYVQVFYHHLWLLFPQCHSWLLKICSWKQYSDVG